MAIRIAFLVRSPRILPIVLSVICLLAPAEAQHGGGGGHSGGGHFGSGHSSGGHSSGGHSGKSKTGGHFGWLRSAFGKHSDRDVGSASSSASNISSRGPAHLWNVPTSALRPSSMRLPSTLLWSPTPYSLSTKGQVSFSSSRVRHDRDFFFRRFPRLSSSGCFWNGIAQVCFFEPLLPLLCFGGDFGASYFGFGFADDALDTGDGLNSQGPMQSEMSAISPSDLSGDDRAEWNSATHSGTIFAGATENAGSSKGVFLLVLNNGSSHAATDYWVADGYLEYISPDGTRSHIPLEALDLQNTVRQNAPRGLPFVLRSTPAQNP